jgi:hypothetical protein
MSLKLFTAPSTISEAEQVIKDGLEALRNAPLNQSITQALTFLTPEGFVPVVQLEEEGRKKRNNAAASNWNPESGEIVIYFERIADSTQAASEVGTTQSGTEVISSIQANDAPSNNYVSAEEVRQCCEALAEAEKAGKLFVALSLFRDTVLPKCAFVWTRSPQSRRRVLDHAIATRAIVTGKAHNPKAPDRPTTTVNVNRNSEMSRTLPPRFNPVPVRGEPVSTTIMRERGSL